MSSDLDSPAGEALAQGGPIELVCLGGLDPVRSRIAPHGPLVIVRTGISRIRAVPGELFTLEVERTWVFGHTRYAKGRVTESRIDADRLALEPLGLESYGARDPEEEPWLFEGGGHSLYEEIRAAGPRPMYGMELVLPEDAVELQWEEDPILEAVELVRAGAVAQAQDLLCALLAADLRCLDAHAHLGNSEFELAYPNALARAGRHYGVGVAIGELTLGADFQGLLPWGMIHNRPYLRCLHGSGLQLWRSGDLDAAAEVFRRLLWLNPGDNQGARFCLAAAEAGRSWEETSW